MGDSNPKITSLLFAAGDGDGRAAERLWRLVYDELRCIAKARLAREGQRGDLQTTVLVQEAYLRLVGHDGSHVPTNRRHFFAAAANAMRRFLVDNARKRGSLKRGGGRLRGELQPTELGDAAAALDFDPDEILALDDALERLQQTDGRKARIIELRYFAGLTIDETAEALGLSPRLVDKEWRFTRAWLHRELS